MLTPIQQATTAFQSLEFVPVLTKSSLRGLLWKHQVPTMADLFVSLSLAAPLVSISPLGKM